MSPISSLASVPCGRLATMDILREFLESSTIHGLNYISTAKVGKYTLDILLPVISQTNIGKLAWLLIVCLGFLTAGYLINSSYSAWLASPVATTITTLPIADLDFPTVTVCPPKDSNTALNYDLMKADNDSLTEQDRENLKNVLYNIIIEPTHQEYIRLMKATVNPGNIGKTLEGYHKFPKQSPEGMVEPSMSNNYGEIQTPWFEESYKEDYYKEDRKQQFEIQISEDLRTQVGSGSLLIQLEVDIREEEGWQEEVKFTKASYGFDIYKLYTEEKSWPDAENHCRKEGAGHLASVLTQEEQEEVGALTGGNDTWIGGSDQEAEGRWR